MKENLTCLLKFHQDSSQKWSFLPSARNTNISIFMPMLGNFVDFKLQNFALECFTNLQEVGREKILPLADATMLSEIWMPVRTGTRYPVKCGSFLHF